MRAPVTAIDDEGAWILAARHGDAQAFGELVRRYQAGTVNVVYRLCGDPALAEDAAQEAFLRAWQHLDRYNARYTFRSWLYRIAVNAALDALRRERPTAELPEALPTGGEGGRGVEARLERRETAAQVQQAVLSLPAASRAVLVLREYEGLSYQEIATALEIPLGTVMSRLNYARGQLRRRLSEANEAP